MKSKLNESKTYETLALTSVEVGKSSSVAVLRLQMRTNEIQQLKSKKSHQNTQEAKKQTAQNSESHPQSDKLPQVRLSFSIPARKK